MRLLFFAVLVCLLSMENHCWAADEAATHWIGSGVVVIETSDRNFVISRVIENSPAQQAGIKVRDRLIEVNDKVLTGLSLSDVLDLMRGELNSKVKLMVTREGVVAPLSFSMLRKPIRVDALPYPTSTD